MKTILFVCTGNVCRSPMAEGLARHLLKNRKDVEVVSAGLAASNGLPPSTNAVLAMKEIGIDISKQRSQQLTRALVERADYIFGMTWGHVDSIRMTFPSAAEKTYLIREFDPTADREYDIDVADPIGGSLDVYLACRDQIQRAVPGIIEFATHSEKPAEDVMVGDTDTHTESGISGRYSLAIAADHGGFELKEKLKSYLQNQGYDCEDFGTKSSESTDYPDYAQALGYSVADGKSDLGILICKSGIGMSISANKIPGIRAALCSDPETAKLSRQHNNANVLCLSANELNQREAEAIVDAWLKSSFEGGRHEQRVSKIESIPIKTDSDSALSSLEKVDPEVCAAIHKETERQQHNIELIASENFTSPAVMAAQGSVLTNKYAEGYPAKRWYGGCEHVDVVEQLAIDRAKLLFGAEHVNVQPHSGSQANMAVYFAFLKPGDTILTMELSHGGHLTHGNKMNFSGRMYNVVHYGVSKESELLDYDQLAALAREHRPKLITAGASAYPRVIDFKRMNEIAKETGALLLIDMAHIAGLVAAGVHPSPIPYADFVTTTTHKTLRGPRGGMIMCREQYAKDIDTLVFPGIQGGPLMHVIAAKAVCLQEALRPEFRKYQHQVVVNAKTLATRLAKLDFRIVSGGTDNHLMLVDVSSHGLTGKDASKALDEAGITVNKNTIPFDSKSPFITSGIRLGTPAVTTRGMKEPEMEVIADFIDQALKSIDKPEVLKSIREKVRELTRKFPLPY